MILGAYMFTQYFNIPYDWDHMPPWSVSLLYELYLMACNLKKKEYILLLISIIVCVCVHAREGCVCVRERVCV